MTVRLSCARTAHGGRGLSARACRTAAACRPSAACLAGTPGGGCRLHAWLQDADPALEWLGLAPGGQPEPWRICATPRYQHHGYQRMGERLVQLHAALRSAWGAYPD